MAEQLGAAIKLPTNSPQPCTRKAFIGMQYALDQGLGNTCVGAVLQALFQHDRDVGDTAVLRAVASAIGLDADAFAEAPDAPEHARRHDAALGLAQHFGSRAAPSIRIGEPCFPG